MADAARQVADIYETGAYPLECQYPRESTWGPRLGSVI